MDTDGRGGAAGADGDGGGGRQRTQARWDRSHLLKRNISAFLTVAESHPVHKKPNCFPLKIIKAHENELKTARGGVGGFQSASRI